MAYFSTTGTGTATASVATISSPSGVTTTQTGADITVGWSAATVSSGGAVDGYRVTRSDGTTVCGNPTLVTTLSCTDSNVPAGSYTYTVTAVFRTWDSSATSGSVTVLTAPTITAQPPNPSNSATASFSFNGGSGSSYQCQLDSGTFAACTSPASYTELSQGSHTFNVRAASGSSTGPSTTYSWSIDTTPPTQSVTLASSASGAYLSGTTLYYKSSASGSFKLQDTVSDSGSGPASATFPALASTGWTHGAETVSTPSGGPYSSSAFTWTAGAAAPPAYRVTGADTAGNTVSTTLSFVGDSTSPSGGAVTVNGVAATAAGSSSSLTNSTSFAITGRTDYTDTGSGLASSVLTVQSESLSGSTCGAPGSGGPFTTATTITGTSQPAGIQAGFCYRYTLTGTDNVSNTSSVSTTVEDDSVSFSVTSQPSSVTAGTATSSTAVTLTAIKNGVTDTGYGGATLSWSGANTSPSGATATLPTSPSWTSGVAKFGITLVKAESETLEATDGTRSATFAAITVGTGSATALAWSGVSTTSSAGVPSPCFFTCTYSSGFSNGKSWTAAVAVTDAEGNTVSTLGPGHNVTVTLGSGASGTLTPASPATLTLPSSGAAVTTATVKYASPPHGSFSEDSLTATSGSYSSATASFSR